MAVPNHASRAALPNAAHRTWIPAMSATPKVVSSRVAAHATIGISGAGTNGFSSATRGKPLQPIANGARRIGHGLRRRRSLREIRRGVRELAAALEACLRPRRARKS